MNFVSIFKDVTGSIVSIGVAAIVGNAIKLTMDPDAKLPKKIAIGIGGIALSGMVSEMTQRYTDDKIDKVVSAVNQVEEIVDTIKRVKKSKDDPIGTDIDETTEGTTH